MKKYRYLQFQITFDSETISVSGGIGAFWCFCSFNLCHFYHKKPHKSIISVLLNSRQLSLYMINYKQEIEDLYFHDSSIESIQFEEGDLFDRKLTVLIDYYNWEGNSEDAENWTAKTLKLVICHCVHLQINAPNLMEDTFEIMSEEYDLEYDAFIKKALDEQSKSYFNYLRSKPLENFLSLKFTTRNFANSLFNEPAGFIWIAGFNVSHEWIDEKTTGKKHITAG